MRTIVTLGLLFVLIFITLILPNGQTLADDQSLATPEPSRQAADKGGRIMCRDTLPEGFSIETNVLSNFTSILVHHRPLGAGVPLRDPILADWSISIPEMIGTSKGFIFGFKMPGHWEAVPGPADAIQYYARSEPLTIPNNLVPFAGPDNMIDRNGVASYLAKIIVKEQGLDIELAIKNLSDQPTDFFSHICNRFHGRGLQWGWRGRTYAKVGDEWILADKLLSGKDGYPKGTCWFVKNNLPTPYLEMFGGADVRKQIITSPYIVMQMEETTYTTIYGSPQGGMIFINADNPCMHSDAWSKDIPAGGTCVQKTFLRVYGLGVQAAVAEFEKEMKTMGY